MKLPCYRSTLLPELKQRNHIFRYGAALRSHWSYFREYYNFLQTKVNVGFAKAAAKNPPPYGWVFHCREELNRSDPEHGNPQRTLKSNTSLVIFYMSIPAVGPLNAEIFIWKVRYYEIWFISWRKLAAGQINISPRVNIVTHKASHLT